MFAHQQRWREWYAVGVRAGRWKDISWERLAGAAGAWGKQCEMWKTESRQWRWQERFRAPNMGHSVRSQPTDLPAQGTWFGFGQLSCPFKSYLECIVFLWINPHLILLLFLSPVLIHSYKQDKNLGLRGYLWPETPLSIADPGTMSLEENIPKASVNHTTSNRPELQSLEEEGPCLGKGRKEQKETSPCRAQHTVVRRQGPGRLQGQREQVCLWQLFQGRWSSGEESRCF